MPSLTLQESSERPEHFVVLPAETKSPEPKKPKLRGWFLLAITISLGILTNIGYMPFPFPALQPNVGGAAGAGGITDAGFDVTDAADAADAADSGRGGAVDAGIGGSSGAGGAPHPG
jgi:hypothetical protein